MREILDLIDLDKMSVDNFCKLFRDVTPVMYQDRSDFLGAMYGELDEVESTELDMAKVRAEIIKLNAAAERDRAAAEEVQRSSNRPS